MTSELDVVRVRERASFDWGEINAAKDLYPKAFCVSVKLRMDNRWPPGNRAQASVFNLCSIAAGEGKWYEIFACQLDVNKCLSKYNLCETDFAVRFNLIVCSKLLHVKYTYYCKLLCVKKLTVMIIVKKFYNDWNIPIKYHFELHTACSTDLFLQTYLKVNIRLDKILWRIKILRWFMH